MSATDLLSVFEQLRRPRVLVLGDLILDRYTWGNAERVSQEAPVILLRADEREARLGGAGNVVAMLRGLDAEVVCAGVVGADDSAIEVRQLLATAGCDARAVLTDATRPTTVKERFIGRAQGRHPHQILRVDSEVRDPLSADLESQLADDLLPRLAEFDIVLVSDYDKGVCTPSLLRRVIDGCRAQNVPVLVDPIRGNDYSRYHGATSMTPNRTEAGLATGVTIRTTADALQAARQLQAQLALDFSIVTLDRDGMALVDHEQEAIFPTQPRAVYDITGAGDMVLAMIGVCLASGLSAADSVRLGNVAGGLEVEKVGVAVIPRAEIRARLLQDRPSAEGKVVGLAQLAACVESHRALGHRVVLAGGCFDLLHVGHLRHLEAAARLGDCLIVAVNSDSSVRRIKGAGRPVIGESDRAALLAALACVNYVHLFDEETPLDVIRAVRPDVLVKGGDYRPEDVVGHELVTSYGGLVTVTPYVDGMSTTDLLSALRDS